MKQNKIIFNFLLITCFSINTSILFGQHSLIITIKDSVTTEPLRFATAYFKGNNHIGFVTDLNGQFIIDASNLNNLQDSIICSFIGYEEKLFPVNLLAKKDLVIYLSPKTILLQEVEVTSKKSNLAPLEIIKKAIKLIPENYETKPIYLNAFYRELIKEDNKAIQVNEAFTKLYYSGYTPKKSFLKRSWRKYWDVGPRILFKYETGKHLFTESQSFYYFNAPNDQAKIVAARTSSNLSKIGIEPSPQGGPLGVTAGDKVKYLYDFLDKNNFSRYNYSLNKVNYYNGELCYIISFYPKVSKKTVFQNISKKMNFAVYAGNIHISINSFAIVGIECQISNIADLSIYDDYPFKTELTVNYKKSENKWYLNSIKTNQLQRFNNNDKAVLYECSRDFYVHKVTLNKVEPFAQKEALLEQRNLTTLRYFPNTYKAAIWDDLEKQEGYFPLESKAKKELEINLPLSTQFKKNSSH